MLPDRRGNNRVDSLRDIVRDPRHRAAVPDPRCGQNSSHQRPRSDKVQRRVIVVTAESVYTQSQGTLPSRLWDARLHVDESSLPSSSTIMKSLQKGFDGETYDRDYPQRLKEIIY